MPYAPIPRCAHQAGVAAVEFAMVVIIFLSLVFATLELARVEYLLNTLQEVTRRAAAAAANVDFKDSAAMQQVQANAVFRNSSGALVLGDPVTASNVKIDYLSVSPGTLELKHIVTLPSCPARNRWNCVADPNGDSCIRFIRARVCASMDSIGSCERLAYKIVFPFFDLSGMMMPIAETIVPAGSLGYTSGSMPCS